MTAADVHAAAITACRDAGATCATCEWWECFRHVNGRFTEYGRCGYAGRWPRPDDQPFTVGGNDPEGADVETHAGFTCPEWQPADDAGTAPGDALCAPESRSRPERPGIAHSLPGAHRRPEGTTVPRPQQDQP